MDKSRPTGEFFWQVYSSVTTETIAPIATT